MHRQSSPVAFSCPIYIQKIWASGLAARLRCTLDLCLNYAIATTCHGDETARSRFCLKRKGEKKRNLNDFTGADEEKGEKFRLNRVALSRLNMF